MKAIWNGILVLLIIIVIAGVLFFRQGSRNPLCEPALFLGQPGNRPEEIVTDIIDELGGLPRQDAALDAIDDPRIIAPVAEWRIRSAVVTNRDDDFLATLWDDDPLMTYAIDLDVAWEDGASGILQWTSWRRGVVSCPLAISKGSGPPGGVRVVALTPAPPEPTGTPASAPEG
jgi:hypothetical protein